jgi:hypothetical protein
MKALTVTMVAAACAVVTLSAHAEGDVKPKDPQVVKLAHEWSSFKEMNDMFADRFVTRRGFGYSRMLDLEKIKTINIGGKPHRIGKVQLIGIAEHKVPMVYQTHGDANRENIKKAKTRVLTTGEDRALARVRNGNEWVMAASGQQPGESHSVLVGALRARESCLKCHDDNNKGDLLGAFRYEIYEVKHIVPAAKPAKPVKPAPPVLTKEPIT